MKNLKKFLAVVLSVAIMATSMATAFAADTSTDPLKDKYPEAAMMRDLGILQGSNGVTEAYLKQQPVRIQAAVLTLRLTGAEANARAYAGLAHFADNISDTYWAKSIMGYLKANASYGWLGDANGKLNPEAKIKKQEFAKVLLKAMGYDQGTHYEWGNNGDGVMAAYMAAGLTTLLDADESLTMNDIAVAINEALTKPVRGSADTLALRLSKVNPDFKAAAEAKGLIAKLAISSVVAPTTASAVEGSIVTPPAQVTANYNDGSSKAVNVKWSAEKFDTSKVGEATLTGTIEGYAAGVTAKLNVVAAAITNVEDIAFEDVYVGDEITLPETVDATFSNGTVEAVPVTWAPADVDTSEAADLTFEGTVAGYDKKVTATMSVVENNIEEVAAIADVTVNEGSALTLPETVEATYTNGDVAEVPVVWDTTAVDVNAPKTYAVKGTVEGFEAGAAVNVVVAPVALDFTLSANNYREVTVTFNKPVVADKLVKGNFEVTGKTINAATVIDSKSVRLTVNSAIAKQAKFEVKAKTATGMAADTTKSSASVIDAVIPEVTSVEAVGNSKIKVTFSEAVETGYLTLSNYKLDNAYFSANVPDLDTAATSRVLTITPTSKLASGVHKFSISNIADAAGYVIAPVVDKEFVVANDTAAPSFVSVESATQTKVVLVMSEEIATPADADVVGAVNESNREVSGNKLTLSYGLGAAAVPVNGMTVTLKNITDVYGNKAGDITVSIPAPTLDLTKPAFVSVAAEGDNAAAKIVVTFSKDVQVSGAITVKDSDGNTKAMGAVTRYVDGDGNNVSTKLYVSGALDAGTYKVSVSGVKDNTGLENVMLPVVDVAVTVADKKAPVVANWYINGVKVYVNFDTEVTKATAENKANYSFVDVANKSNALDSDTTATLLADNQTVEIAFKAGTDMSKIAYIQVANVTDASGNTMIVTNKQVSTIGGLPALTATAAVTGTNTIVVTFNHALVASTVALNDFAVNAGGTPVRVYNVSYADKKVTLSTVDNISADGKVGANAVVVSMGSSVSAADAFGTKIAANTALATSDAVAPVASAVASKAVVGGNTVIKLTMSESLKAANLADANLNDGQFYVVIDGSAKVATVTATATEMTLTVTGTFSGKSFEVRYAPIADAIEDVAGNDLGAFTYSGTID